MDISALSLAFGATIETVGQVTGEAGFDAVLEQVDPAGFIPPGAPPGPEPPPDLLVAGEEVEVVEPNAQPQKLDFHPLQKVDIDVELPKPFWEASADTDQVDVSTQSPGTADEAMKWLVGQMSDSFFNIPDVATGCPTPKADPLRSRSEYLASIGEGLPFCPPGFYGNFEATDVDADLAGMEGVPGSEGDSNFQLPIDSKNPNPVQTNRSKAQLIDEEVAESLNITSIQASGSGKPDVEVGADTLRTARNPKEQTAEDSPSFDPAPVGVPVAKDRPSKSDYFNGKKRSTEEGLQPSPSADLAAKELGRTKPQRNGNAEEKAIKVDGAKAIDTDATVVTKTPAGEATPDRNQSHDKKATSKSEWTELVSAKAKSKAASFEEEKVGTEKNIDASSVVTATPELKKPSLKPEEAELVVKQVADKLHMLAAARPRNGVTIHLNPDDLGSITVVIKSVGRMVDTQITASDPRVSEALDQNRTRLVEAMDSRGFQLQSVTVSQQSGHSTQQDSSSRNWQQANQEQSQRQSQSGQQQGHRGHNDRQFDQPKANIRAWVRRGEGVDLAI